MSSLSSNLGLKLFDESDYVDFEDINNNFELLDTANACKSVDTATSTYTNGSSSVANWYIKRYASSYTECETTLNFASLSASSSSSSYTVGDTSLYAVAVTELTLPVAYTSQKIEIKVNGAPFVMVSSSVTNQTVTIVGYLSGASVTWGSATELLITVKGVET